MHPRIDEIAGWLRSARRVVALTGAGISTESGVPDFRGPQGIWTKNPESEKLSDIHHYMRDRDVRVRAWKARLDSPIWTAEPNAGHFALAALEKKGHLQSLVTQNIDGLHLKAGTSEAILTEIHGHSSEVVCMSCGERAPTERALARVRAGEDDPPCKTCGGILKTATISFGQSLVPEDLDRSFDAARTCDLLLTVGTTLVVYPIAYMADLALESAARLVVINAEPTLYDERADAVFREPIGELLPAIVDRV